jgi:SPP1 Gp6-like portal protein
MADSPDVIKAIKMLAERQERIKTYRRYYDGDHNLAFATNKFKNAFADLFKEFAYNMCPSVVDAPADRLRITGFGKSTAGDQAWAIWQANHMTQRAGEVHSDALIVGDAYVIVWPDATNAPIISVNTAEETIVHYADEDRSRIDWAAKRWSIGKQIRLNLYYDNRIEKYITGERSGSGDPSARAFQAYEIPGEPWPVPHDYGRVPVFHFGNNARQGTPGRSELKDVIPLQDALNKAVADMLVAMEFVALPQRWATGIEVKRDPVTGEPISPWRPSVDSVWSAPDADVRFGQFDPANLTQFLDVQDRFLVAIARVSRTPLHYIMPQTGNFPSGESLKTAETPFLAKVADRMESFGNTWQEVMLFALLVAETPAATADDIAVDWRDPAPKSQKEQAETAAIKQGIGVPLAVLLAELDYTESEIEDMLTAEQDRQVAATTATLDVIAQRQAAASGGVGAVGDQAFVNSQQ